MSHEKPLNPYLAAMLVLPTLHALSMPTVTLATDGPSANQTLGTKLMSTLEEAIERGRQFTAPKVRTSYVTLDIPPFQIFLLSSKKLKPIQPFVACNVKS